MPFASFDLVAFDCPDPHALAEFYQAIAGGEIDPKSDDEWVELHFQNGATIAFQRDDYHRPPVWPGGSPQQAHLDFDTPDLDSAEAAVLMTGAQKAEFQPRPDRWRVFIDPAGHPFCLVQHP